MTELAQVASWLVDSIEAGKDGADLAWHGTERRWDFGLTLQTLHVAQMRSSW